ncbi:MAG: hypothetical protein KAV87_06805 [Desulfobacteraceae bacterium]|nr:hypothetical protein [Desulfobacteraceae bacterium]
MRPIKIMLITMLWICSFASHAGGGKQETEKSFFEILQSFDDTVLQLALRTKCDSARMITIGREPLVFLSGIDRVRVIIMPQLKEYGLTEEAVKTSIELRLRRNGIKLHDAPDDPNGLKAFMLSHPNSVFFMSSLSLTIDSISLSKPDVVAADVDLSQSQIVNLLSAERPTFLVAETWHAGQQVIGSRKNVARGCQEAIDELVDMYCNDWLAAHTDQKTCRLPQD